MGFVRHELGVRLRLKRIPALHVSLDDSAERGTRVLRILDELEQGHDAAGEALADAPRGRDAADAGPAASAARATRSEPTSSEPAAAGGGAADAGSARPRRTPAAAGTTPRPPRAGTAARRSPAAPGRPASAARPAMTAGVGPRRRSPRPSRTPSSSGCAAARSVLAVGHENPDADALGAALAIAMLVEARGGRATVAVQRRRPGPVRVPARASTRVRTDPEPGAAYDLVVLCDCGDLSRGRARSASATRTCFAATPLLTIDHHASNDGARRPRLDRPGRGRDLRDGRPPRGPPRASRSPPATEPSPTALTGRHRDGHRDLRPPERDPAHPARSRPRSSRPAHPCPTSAGGSTGRSPTPSWRSSAASWPGSSGTPTGSSIASTMELADLAATGARSEHSEGIIDLLAQSETAEVALLLKEKGAETRLSVRTKPGGVDATVLCGTWGGGGHARAAGASLPAAAGRGHGGRAARGRASGPRGPSVPGRATPRRPGRRPGRRRSSSSTSRSGPTSHDIVALVRRLAGTRKIGHGGTLDPFASGVLPLYLGLGTRVVEFHLGARKAYRATVVFGAALDDRRPRGRADPGRRAAPRRATPSRPPSPASSARSEQRPPAFSARKVGGRRAYALARRGRDARAEAPRR